MSNSISIISVSSLLYAFIPVAAVIAILWRWSVDARTLLVATFRMVLQLALIGYVLTFIFDSDSAGVIVLVLCVMLVASSLIALRPVKNRDRSLYLKAFGAIAIGGIVTLAIITQGVLELEPWYAPRAMVPIAGMIFSNAMNTVSLAAERFTAELDNAQPYAAARKRALEASLIPMVNAFLAVGLVSLPGMMTGQILSGVEPHIAVRYQIMVMCMTFGAAGISAIIYLLWQRPDQLAASGCTTENRV